MHVVINILYRFHISNEWLFWMYQVSLKELCMMDYYNGVKGFIIYVQYNSKKILVEVVLDVHVRGMKIKSFLMLMLLWCIYYK